MGFEVEDTGYFVYANALKTPERFDARLSFDIRLLPYTGNTGWVEGAVRDARACLMADTMPAASGDCEFCGYRALSREVE